MLLPRCRPAQRGNAGLQRVQLKAQQALADQEGHSVLHTLQSTMAGALQDTPLHWCAAS